MQLQQLDTTVLRALSMVLMKRNLINDLEDWNFDNRRSQNSVSIAVKTIPGVLPRV